MYLSREHKILLSLVKESLWSDNALEGFALGIDTDWSKVINYAAQQGIMAVAHDGFVKSGQSLVFPKDLLIRWQLSTRNIEARNKKQSEVLKELVKIFRDNGVELLLLKGIGQAQNYPVPNHRESGDIDIYLFGDYEKGNGIIESMGIEVDKKGTKHSKFFYKGIPVENHKTLLNVQNTTDANLEKILYDILDKQGYDTIMVDDIAVRIPTPDFNAIFLTRHDVTHFLASGLVLRHFCDLALFFEKNIDRIDVEKYKGIMEKEGLYNLVCSFLSIATLDNNYDRMAEKILEDTLLKKIRPIDASVLEAMWVPRRKLIGLKYFLASKWKYDIIDKWLFYKVFILRVWLSIS